MMKRNKIIIISVIAILGILGFLTYYNLFFLKIFFTPPQTYSPTVLSENDTDLFVSLGNINNDTAFIYAQGGPSPVLFTNDNPLLLLPNSTNILRIYPQQTQITNKSIFAAKPALTEKQADFELQKTVEIISRTISYFKNMEKVVYVICYSHGSYIGLEYLNTKENLADKFVIMGARFDADPVSSATFRKGKIVKYEDGIEPSEENPFPDFWCNFSAFNQNFANAAALMISGEKEYVELLKDVDLSKVIFVYANKDECVGRPNELELNFCKKKKIQTIEMQGGHMSMNNSEFMAKLYNLLIE